jgi:hypothetical protein
MEVKSNDRLKVLPGRGAMLVLRGPDSSQLLEVAAAGDS